MFNFSRENAGKALLFGCLIYLLFFHNSLFSEDQPDNAEVPSGPPGPPNTQDMTDPNFGRIDISSPPPPPSNPGLVETMFSAEATTPPPAPPPPPPPPIAPPTQSMPSPKSYYLRFQDGTSGPITKDIPNRFIFQEDGMNIHQTTMGIFIGFSYLVDSHESHLESELNLYCNNGLTGSNRVKILLNDVNGRWYDTSGEYQSSADRPADDNADYVYVINTDICNQIYCNLSALQNEPYNYDISGVTNLMNNITRSDDLQSFIGINNLRCKAGHKIGKCIGKDRTNDGTCNTQANINNKIICEQNPLCQFQLKDHLDYEDLFISDASFQNSGLNFCSEANGEITNNLDIFPQCSNRCYPIVDTTGEQNNILTTSKMNNCYLLNEELTEYTTNNNNTNTCNPRFYTGEYIHNIVVDDAHIDSKKNDINQISGIQTDQIENSCTGGGDTFKTYNNCSPKSCVNYKEDHGHNCSIPDTNMDLITAGSASNQYIINSDFVSQCGSPLSISNDFASVNSFIDNSCCSQRSCDSFFSSSNPVCDNKYIANNGSVSESNTSNCCLIKKCSDIPDVCQNKLPDPNNSPETIPAYDYLCYKFIEYISETAQDNVESARQEIITELSLSDSNIPPVNIIKASTYLDGHLLHADYDTANKYFIISNINDSSTGFDINDISDRINTLDQASVARGKYNIIPEHSGSGHRHGISNELNSKCSDPSLNCCVSNTCETENGSSSCPANHTYMQSMNDHPLNSPSEFNDICCHENNAYFNTCGNVNPGPDETLILGCCDNDAYNYLVSANSDPDSSMDGFDERKCKYSILLTPYIHPKFNTLPIKNALINNIKLPEKYEEFSFHSYETLPLPTEHLEAFEVLKLRDEKFHSYFERPEFLRRIQEKFGDIAVKNIKEMTTIIIAGTVIQSAKILAEELVTLSLGTKNLKKPSSYLILKSINSL